MKRSNLTQVKLTLKSMGVNNFSYLNVPSAEQENNAFDQLCRLGALGETGLLTELGRKMASLPLQPNLAHMLVNSVKLGCSFEMCTIVGMMVQDNVFELPSEFRHAAKEKMARFDHPGGDLLTLLKIFNTWRDEGCRASWCVTNFIDFSKMNSAKLQREHLEKIMRQQDLPIVSCGSREDLVQTAICETLKSNTARKDRRGGYWTEGKVSHLVKVPSSSVYFRIEQPEVLYFEEVVQTTDQFMRRLTAAGKQGLDGEGHCSISSPVGSSSQHIEGIGELARGSIWDSHCHFDFIQRDMKRKGVTESVTLQRTLQMDSLNLGNKFGGCVVNCCQPLDWAENADFSLLTTSWEEEGVFLSLGCHPHFADNFHEGAMSCLRNLHKKLKGRMVAIGECGLDISNKNTVPIATQKRVFGQQLELAMELGLPIVLHIRGAEEEAFKVLREKRVPQNWPLHYHCFTGNYTQALEWCRTYPASKIGLTGLVTFPDAVKVHEVARQIPLEKLVLETDAPYFLPTTVDKNAYRHSFSLPGHVLLVAAQVASLKGVELKTVIDVNKENIAALYGCAT